MQPDRIVLACDRFKTPASESVVIPGGAGSSQSTDNECLVRQHTKTRETHLQRYIVQRSLFIVLLEFHRPNGRGAAVAKAGNHCICPLSLCVVLSSDDDSPLTQTRTHSLSFPPFIQLLYLFYSLWTIILVASGSYAARCTRCRRRQQRATKLTGRGLTAARGLS